ncbi:MAG: hypothetical protein V4850_24945 [Myxococcota bacterium]
MLLVFFALAGPALAEDTADTADTAGEERDTDPHLDTGAVSEQVYVEDVGCSALSGGAGAVLAALGFCVVVALGRGGRR